MTHNDMPVELRLAAVIHLLSSSALRGTTSSKTEALRDHLRSIASHESINPHLKNTLQEVLGGWEAVHCHHGSVPVDYCPLISADRTTH